MPTARPYHHGNLRWAVLAAAVEAITEVGPAGVSLRDLARRAGVSHAAPAHHFGDKAGLLTALAAEGYSLLADALEAAQHRTRDFLEVGVAYVRFAVEHRAHFEVMFRPDLYHPDDLAVRGGLVTGPRLRHPLAQRSSITRTRRRPRDRGPSRRRDTVSGRRDQPR
jgi:AcrR family transcriptional regulator